MIEPLTTVSKYRRIALAALTALAGLLLAPAVPAAAGDFRSAGRASYILFVPGSRSTTMSGSMDDLRRARTLRVGEEGLLYIREGAAAYVIRDPDTLRRAEAVFKPQEVLGARQAELGSRQAALGSRQAALGREQARLGLQQASSSPQRSEELGRRQEELGRQQDALGRQQDELGRRQDALGREQARLGRESEEKFRALLAEALQRGVARRVE